jgi:hypothetical protein
MTKVVTSASSLSVSVSLLLVTEALAVTDVGGSCDGTSTMAVIGGRAWPAGIVVLVLQDSAFSEQTHPDPLNELGSM